jgi:serine/threonine-protein kinase
MRGEILGTAAYMSPEQAAGRVVDKRTDVWAFGVCLWEALTGKRAFRGEDAATTLAAVLRDPINFALLPPDCPRALRRCLERCLERDRRLRLRDMGDARLELESAASEGPELPAQTAGGSRRAWIGAAILAVLGLVVGALGSRLVSPPAASKASSDADRVQRFVSSSDDRVDRFAAISPDGSRVAYTTVSRRASQSTSLQRPTPNWCQRFQISTAACSVKIPCDRDVRCFQLNSRPRRSYEN